MFGRRGDGKKVKDLQIIDKAISYFMPMRIDAVNKYTQVVPVEAMDKFILEQKKNGVHYTYTEIMMAACVRMLYERPKTNRFVNNCVVYQRDKIWVSMNIKKSLTDDGEEVTLKMEFTGRESLPEVKKILDDEIAKNLSKDEVHRTTKVASMFCKLPNWLFKFTLGFCKFLDKHNMWPKWLIKASPFHTSIYIADLRSIKLDKLYHHLYNFGTTTIFATLSKVKYIPVANRLGEITTKKTVDLGLTLDERVCDGLYYANSVRLLMSFLENPDILLEHLPEPELTGKALKKKLKEDRKKAKREAKEAKKEAKVAQKNAKKDD